ncbi:hypothetical protein CYMTET_35196 [Cymbomonas tetramitiformis]|uniref:C3H1-type domain-containing protein n=1 Tax=Cymbomonas tetramitiformis TaxID=36881 RepID=A0AAE0KP75_9CHLO|nr:hypothetical protein CYMTET_35196 [Cymbomonas tetramitiformis]
MARLVPATQHKLLLYFHTWFVTKVSEYGFAAMAMFYDFFILSMEADDSVSFKMGSYSDTFAAYIVETNVKPQGGGGSAGGGKRSKWTWERQQQQVAPADGDREQSAAQQGKGKGKGGGRSKGGKGGGQQTFPHVRDACHWHNVGQCTYKTCKFRHVCGDCGADDHVSGAAACPGPP